MEARKAGRNLLKMDEGFNYEKSRFLFSYKMLCRTGQKKVQNIDKKSTKWKISFTEIEKSSTF